MTYHFHHPKHSRVKQVLESIKAVPLGDICRESIIHGRQPEYDDTGDVIALKTVDLKNDHINYDDALRVSAEFFEAHPTAHVRKDDILIASTGYVSMGKVDVYDRAERAMASGELLVLRVNRECDPYFVCYFMRSPLGQVQFDKWFSGSSGQIHIYNTGLAAFLVPATGARGIPLEDQKRIARLVTRGLEKARKMERLAREKWQQARQRFEKIVQRGS